MDIIQSENDGKITLTFYNNNLEVRGDFFPPSGNGAPITPEYILSLLEKSNITYGINHDQINKAYFDCINNQEIVRDVLVASGDPPVTEVPEYLQYNPYLMAPVEEVEEKDSVDHRERSAFIIVKKGQALAKLKHRKPGREGMNVFGETIEFKTMKTEVLTGGENTRMEGRFLLSSINGQLIRSKGVLSVSDSLVIKGPVGYGTGNIIFPGNVEIEGPVSDGFKIFSGGSVHIKQTFDVTEAITKQDLIVAGGIIGRGKAQVKVGGALKTKFIENCNIAVRRAIDVETEIINSKVFTLEELEMGDKGQIVGGEIYAMKGIRAGRIGKETGKAAKLHCGIDFTLDQEKEKNNNILKNIAAKLRRIKELKEEQAGDEEKMAKLEALERMLEEEQNKSQKRVTDLLGKLNAYEDAVIEVKGEIVPGTLIEICQTALYVTETMKKVKIRYNRGLNKIITEKL